MVSNPSLTLTYCKPEMYLDLNAINWTHMKLLVFHFSCPRILLRIIHILMVLYYLLKIPILIVSNNCVKLEFFRPPLDGKISLLFFVRLVHQIMVSLHHSTLTYTHMFVRQHFLSNHIHHCMHIIINIFMNIIFHIHYATKNIAMVVSSLICTQNPVYKYKCSTHRFKEIKSNSRNSYAL